MNKTKESESLKKKILKLVGDYVELITAIFFLQDTLISLSGTKVILSPMQEEFMIKMK